MASPAQAKSQQPLHNFPLPSLWSKSHHRGRRHHSAAGARPERRRISDPTVQNPPQWESRRISVSIPRPSHPTAQKKPPLPTPPSDRKISIKIRGTHPPKTEEIERERQRKAEAEEREREKKAEAEEREKREKEAVERERERKAEAEADDELAKTWNLRPRKQQKTKRNKTNVGQFPENKTICAASEAAAEGGDKQRETEKPKFSLSLSKTEIEEDLFAMTGSRPTRRPKKRPRTVQKQLDDIFPGMWLHSITPESYKVNEASEKP